MLYKKEKMGGYNLHTIKTDKFKLCHMEVIFRNNAVKEDMAKRNILFDYLSECSKKYPTKREINLKLEDLYSASLYNVTSKVGNAVFTNFCIDFISPKYTDNNIVKDAIELIFEMILNPLASNNEFDSKLFDFIKERNRNDIKSIKENPKKFATLEALKTLGEESSSSYGSVGTLEDLDNVTAENLYTYYEEVLKNDYIDIYMIGDADMDEVSKYVEQYAKFKVIKNHEFNLYTQNEKRRARIVSDHFKYAQTNIVMLLSLNKLNPYEKRYVANLYNIILGGGSLETKLYKRLRGENSLCYNVTSMYQKYDGLIIINTAVDINASKKAVKLIKTALKDMTNNISLDELNKAKSLVETSLNMTKDNIGKLVDNYFYQDISDLEDFETRIKTFKEVTVEDIYKLAKKISISTEYSLIGGEIDEEN